MNRQRVAVVVVLSAVWMIQSRAEEQTKETSQQAVVRLTNEYRESQKVAALTTNAKLSKLAQGHAENMARQDKYGDDGKNGHVLDGKGPKDRIEAGGYEYRNYAENVGYTFGQADPVKAVMEAWKKSEGHNKNLLNEVFVEMGAGVARSESGKWYFCQVFGKPLASEKK